MLKECVNLRELTVPMFVEHIGMDDPTVLARYVRGRDQMTAGSARTFLKAITGLPKLRSLDITCRASIASYWLKGSYHEEGAQIYISEYLERNTVNNFARGLKKLLQRLLHGRGVDISIEGRDVEEDPYWGRHSWLQFQRDGSVQYRQLWVGYY
jgi:hypothetical protein